VLKPTTDILEERQALRRTLTERRAQLSSLDVERASKEVGLRLFGLRLFTSAQKIALYAATRGEIDLTKVAKELLLRGKQTHYPRVESDTPPVLSFRRAGPDELRIGRYRIPEPAPEQPIADITGLDVILVPALAFDRHGGRLGFGRGFYDASLRHHPRSLRIGIGHDFQLFNRLPIQDHDEPVDVIITPEALQATCARALFPSQEIE
jgi:5-formyltetrahydrofolate cyclo-ligase